MRKQINAFAINYLLSVKIKVNSCLSTPILSKIECTGILKDYKIERYL